MKVKKAVPTSNQDFRPHISERNPITGLKIMPVKVETETISPTSESLAPREAANIGKRGVFPI
tara:strand:- start:237 stop:425 length:189 start_codon:yes stop_codon:yes gene_type:complete